MRVQILFFILLLVLSLLSRRLQDLLRSWLTEHPHHIFLAPALLAGMFCAAAGWAGAFSLPLVLLIAAYLFLPTWLAFLQGPGLSAAPALQASQTGPEADAAARGIRPPQALKTRYSNLDFAIIALLWLPIEFGAGAGLIARPAQGFLHSVAYGIAILLALVLFLAFRGWEGMKYRCPGGLRDFLYAAMGFAISAPVLILIGRAVDFIPPWHAPLHPAAGRMVTQFLIILAATALPEEILFRSLIQNGLMQRFGAGTPVLLLASLIFGCAHLNNGPQALPNWRYMILATIAGVAYGKVFQKSTSVWGSAMLHALVDWTKHLLF